MSATAPFKDTFKFYLQHRPEIDAIRKLEIEVRRELPEWLGDALKRSIQESLAQGRAGVVFEIETEPKQSGVFWYDKKCYRNNARGPIGPWFGLYGLDGIFGDDARVSPYLCLGVSGSPNNRKILRETLSRMAKVQPTGTKITAHPLDDQVVALYHLPGNVMDALSTEKKSRSLLEDWAVKARVFTMSLTPALS